MADTEPVVLGREKLTNIFGRWPSFHDAEVIELNFWRGDVEPDKNRYIFPVLTVKVHLWEMASHTDDKGFFLLGHHTLATLRFHHVDNFKMEGFNHQNAIFGLSITKPENVRTLLLKSNFNLPSGYTLRLVAPKLKLSKR